LRKSCEKICRNFFPGKFLKGRSFFDETVFTPVTLAPSVLSPARGGVAMAPDSIVIPNDVRDLRFVAPLEMDRDDVFDVAIQSPTEEM
jgi:hypothetical protein